MKTVEVFVCRTYVKGGRNVDQQRVIRS